MAEKLLEKLLPDNLTDGRKAAVKSKVRHLLVVAGAGTGSA
jgi:superfamily I DNA/RNA helicase